MVSTSISVTDADMRTKITLDSRFGWTELARMGLGMAARGWYSVAAVEDEFSTLRANIGRLQAQIAALVRERDELVAARALDEVAAATEGKIE